jgi:thiamine pyrophosphate-dependent acetolactate synthase large subunit-like protein
MCVRKRNPRGRECQADRARALQFAHSAPSGPVYVTAPREVLESEVPRVTIDTNQWRPVAPSGLNVDAAREIAGALAAAERPLIVTSYLGRSALAVQELISFAEHLGVGVIESVPNHVNFPTTHSCYLGVQWNERRQNEALASADLVLVIDSDVPWISAVSRPARVCASFTSMRSAQTADAAVVHRRDPAMPGGRIAGVTADPRRSRNSHPIRTGLRGVGNISRPSTRHGRPAVSAREQPRAELTANTWWPAYAMPSVKTPSSSARR